MANLSNEVINNIQSSASIVDIIGSYVSLEKKGKNYFCVCPFHDDHNPSMSVNEEKGIYTCFVCHKTGNVFSFVQEYENVSFIEAVKIVASRVGISLDITSQPSKYDKHYEVMNLASKVYQNNLNSSEGKKAKEYLHNRGINDEIIEEFQIGYASSRPDAISNLLMNKNYDQQLILDVGLSNFNNNIYDVFRNRITFPIHNAHGKTVAFSARIYDNSNDAKYINTKETVIFKKGEILFNYHRAQNEARRLKSLILVEGQMDAIRIYASGIKNVVATMGTALTSDHIKLLKKLNVNLILCFDADSAGESATITNGEALVKENLDVSVLRLSDTKDPDEYIIKNGVDKFKESINNAISYFDFKLNYLKKNKDLNKVDDVSNYIKDVINELNKSGDDVLIDLTLNKLVKEYGVDKNVLLNQIIKTEPVKSVKVEVKLKEKLSKTNKLYELLLFYMMNDIKYIKLFEQEVSFLPNDTYNEIAHDLLAFYIKYNYINIADFISYEINSDYYENVLNIIDNNINNTLIDEEYIGLIDKIKVLIDEDKIKKLKISLQETTDINEKLKITDEIAKMKKRMCKE